MGRSRFISAIPLSSLQPPPGSTWDDILADTDFAGSTTNDVLLSDVAPLCGTETTGEESWVPFCESSIFDIDLDNQLLSEISLISLMFGETTLANIPAPNGAPSWCGSGGPAAGSCGSYGDAELKCCSTSTSSASTSAAWRGATSRRPR